MSRVKVNYPIWVDGVHYIITEMDVGYNDWIIFEPASQTSLEFEEGGLEYSDMGEGWLLEEGSEVVTKHGESFTQLFLDYVNGKSCFEWALILLNTRRSA